MFIVENKIGNSRALKCRFLYYLVLFLLLGCISCFHLHFSSSKVRFARFLLTFGRSFLHLRSITNCTHQRREKEKREDLRNHHVRTSPVTEAFASCKPSSREAVSDTNPFFISVIFELSFPFPSSIRLPLVPAFRSSARR